MQPHIQSFNGNRRVLVTYRASGLVFSDQMSTSGQFSDSVTGFSSVAGKYDRDLLHPFTYVATRVNQPKGTHTAYDDSFITLTSGYHGSQSGLTIPPWATTRSLCYTKALSRLYEKVRGSLDLAQDVFESAQTKRMLKAVARFERDFKGFGPKNWANYWLEVRYGWQPLLQDIYDAADELSGYVENRLSQVRSSAKLALPDAPDWTCHGKTISVSDSVTSRTAVAACKLHTWWDFSRGQPPLTRWTSLNPATIAWELLPYSFVVDWFYDVGTYLRQSESSYLYQGAFVKGCVSELYVYKSLINMDERKNYGSFSNPVRFALTGTQRVVQFQRTLMSGAPVPRSPTFVVDLSWKHLVDLGGLISQRIFKLGAPAKNLFGEIPRWPVFHPHHTYRG